MLGAYTAQAVSGQQSELIKVMLRGRYLHFIKELLQGTSPMNEARGKCPLKETNLEKSQKIYKKEHILIQVYGAVCSLGSIRCGMFPREHTGRCVPQGTYGAIGSLALTGQLHLSWKIFPTLQVILKELKLNKSFFRNGIIQGLRGSYAGHCSVGT